MPITAYGQDDMEWLESGYVVRRIFNGYKVWLALRRERPSLVSGFSVFGSLVSGVVRHTPLEGEGASDVDIATFDASSVEGQVVYVDDELRVGAQVVGLRSIDLPNLFAVILAAGDSATLPKQALSLKYLLMGIPIGDEVVELQRTVLEQLQGLSEAESAKVWKVLSLAIRDAETGRSNSTGKKYSMIGDPLSVQAFQDRWKERVALGRRLCEKYGFEF